MSKTKGSMPTKSALVQFVTFESESQAVLALEKRSKSTHSEVLRLLLHEGLQKFKTMKGRDVRLAICNNEIGMVEHEFANEFVQDEISKGMEKA